MRCAIAQELHSLSDDELHARYLQRAADGQRIVCALTAHELPLDVNAINAYMQTSSYRRAVALLATMDRYKNFLEDDGCAELEKTIKNRLNTVKRIR